MTRVVSEALATAAPAVVDGRWIRPARTTDAEPRWGHAEGLHIGIAPTPGPRGLLRVYTPYLGHERDCLVNFIAVEPIPSGQDRRGFSELEPSTLDPGESGKRFWSADHRENTTPRVETDPARGVVDEIDGVEHLTVWIICEKFDNGADVSVRVRFRADRPHEVEVAGFTNDASVALDHLILTATMGNWARLRQLELVDHVATPADLWPGFEGAGFTEHARFPLSAASRDGNGVVVTASGDETDPLSVEYSADTNEHWHFSGELATQSWHVDDPHPAGEVWVNARWAYWASESPIPGGPAYENFEIVEPFRQGAAYRFSVDQIESPSTGGEQ